MSLRDTINSLRYKVPDGKVDVPYIYTYDASGLTDGTSFNPNIVTNNDSDFILRRVAGLNLVVNPNTTGKFLLYDRGLRQMSQSPIRPGVLPFAGNPVSGVWPVMPESVFTPSSVITLALQGILRNFTADVPNVYNSQIGFCGVRRYDASRFRLYQTPYKYRELPYTYTYLLRLNWAHWTDNTNGIPSAVQTFSVPVLQTDFELCAIGVTTATGQLVTTNDFRLNLYDASGSHKFASKPVNLPFWNYNAPVNYGSPVFPIPSLVYPIKGQITFDIESMLPFGTTGAYVLHFMGIWRAPA